MDKNRLLELAGMDAPPEEASVENSVDSVEMEIPLFIRLLEWAHEDAQNDMQIHKVSENLIDLSKEGMTLSMDDYEAAIAGVEEMNGEEMNGEEEPPTMNDEEPMPGM